MYKDLDGNFMGTEKEVELIEEMLAIRDAQWRQYVDQIVNDVVKECAKIAKEALLEAWKKRMQERSRRTGTAESTRTMLRRIDERTERIESAILRGAAAIKEANR